MEEPRRHSTVRLRPVVRDLPCHPYYRMNINDDEVINLMTDGSATRGSVPWARDTFAYIGDVTWDPDYKNSRRYVVVFDPLTDEGVWGTIPQYDVLLYLERMYELSQQPVEKAFDAMKMLVAIHNL